MKIGDLNPEQSRSRAKCADEALSCINIAWSEPDAMRQQNIARFAQALALVSLGYAVQEATATLRHVVERMADSNAELAARMQEVA